MIRAKGRIEGKKLVLEQPLDLVDGTEVVVDVYSPEDLEHEAWSELGMRRLEEEWDNPDDAIYDDWKKLYGA
jgi:hypothetical protein